MARVSTTHPKPKAGGKRTPRKKTAAGLVEAPPAAPQKKVSRTRPAAPRRKTSAAKPAKTAAPRRRAARVAAVPAAPRLPESYGTRRLFLVARDPRWLYAHWDFSREEQRALNRLSATGRLVLRVYQGSVAGPLAAQSELQAESRHWFVPVDSGGARYIAELGYMSRAGGWVEVALSGAVVTPPDTVAPEAPVLFATIPPDGSFREVIQILGVSVAQNVPQTEVVRQFQATEELPAVKVFPPEQQWTPRQALELARVIGPQEIQQRMQGELSSPAIARLIPSRPPSLSGPSGPSGSPVGGWGRPGGWSGWGGGWSGSMV
jgi:hypothetical protein